MLEAGLQLIAEQGVVGASLRELARRLGMSQPSLYHYFESKEQLVEQITRYCADQMLVLSADALPTRKEELPGFVAAQVQAIWATERHARFLRFLFAVTGGAPEQRATVQRVIEERLSPAFDAAARLYVSDPAEAADVANLLRMVTYALAFPLMEDRALMGMKRPRKEFSEYARWVTRAAEQLLAAPPSTTGTARRHKRSRR